MRCSVCHIEPLPPHLTCDCGKTLRTDTVLFLNTEYFTLPKPQYPPWMVDLFDAIEVELSE